MRSIGWISALMVLALAGCSEPPESSYGNSTETTEIASAEDDYAEANVAEVDSNAAAPVSNEAEPANVAEADSNETEPANTAEGPIPNMIAFIPERPYCDAIDTEASPKDCARFTRERANLAEGLAVFNPPSQMTVGDSLDVTLSVGKRVDAAEVRASVAGDRKGHVEIRTRVGHFMTATLSGGGFEIKPEGPQRATLGADRREIWLWHVTAKQAGAQQLLLTVSTDATASDGTRSRYSLATRPFAVAVKVSAAENRQEKAKAIKGDIDNGTMVLGGLQNLLIAIGLAVTALGGIWWAIRNFGKKPPETGKDGPKE
jgi:hypothetical protein